MTRALARTLFALAVVAAAARVTALGAVLPLDALAPRLRRAGRLPPPFRDPARLAAAVERLGHVVPPWGVGWCLKRSLLLVDLWARCGLEPRLHVGVRRGEGRRLEGHAWVSAEGGTMVRGEPGRGSGFVEAWVR